MDVLRVIKTDDDTRILEKYHISSETMKTNHIVDKSTVGKDTIFYMIVKQYPGPGTARSKA
jgi:hypothetical protein